MTKIYIIALLIGVKSFSQIKTDLKKYQEEHPNSRSVRINQETVITVVVVDGELKITKEVLEEDLFLDKSATYSSKQSLSFSSFFEIEKIEAYSYIPDNIKYQEIKVQNFKEKDDLETSFYDDTKSLNFIYPNLCEGAQTKLKYSQKINNPRFLSAFYFGDFYPIINNKVTIIADKNVDFIFQKFNTEGFDIVFNKSENRKSNVYTWEIKNVDEFELEADSPDYKNIIPHIIPRISSYKIDGQHKRMLADVSDLYAWYFSLVENINQEDSDQDLVQLVYTLTKDKSNDLEKARAIYYWTQENIKYVAFEYALGGFVPREANDVFQKKYGDCKDNSSILFKMLQIAGIKGHLTWIGTRSIPYRYNEVPTPAVDNHMILSFDYDDRTYFLDATGRYTSIDFPTSFIQGKEALVAKSKDTFEIKIVPVIESNKSFFKDSTVIELKENNLYGKSKVEVSGYIKSDYFYALEKKDTPTKIKAYYNSIFQKGNNSFLIENLSEDNKYDYDKNFEVCYDFEISNHATILEDEIYINLNLNKRLLTFKTKENRKTPIEFEYKDYYNYQTVLTVPEGYTIEYMPENFQISDDNISSSIQYEVDNNQIKYQHILRLGALKLDLKAQRDLNHSIEQMEKHYKEVVVLKKIF